MGRRRKKGRPVSGWLVVDKAYDMGSTETVSKARWLFQAQKAGHAGTLDPLATGVLPIAFGEATKTVPYIMDAKKRYEFTARWGAATTTDDVEGEIIAKSDHRPDKAAIETALGQFIGEIDQTPPQFSAIKIDGERAYDIAREGEEVAIPSRQVMIYELRLVDVPDADHAVFEAVTGKGAYVRAIVRDLAKALGTEGHVSALRRTAVGPFDAARAISLTDVEATQEVEGRDSFLEGVEAALSAMPQTSIGGPEAERLRRGQAAIISPASAKGLRGDRVGDIEEVLASLHGAPVAICALEGLKLKPSRVFNL